MSELKKNPTAADYMTHLPSTVDEGLSLADAQERMYVNNIRHLVVTRGGGKFVVGVISNRDISVALGLPDVDPAKLTVSAAMVSDPYRCTPSTPLLEVAEQMEAHKFGCVVVCEGDTPVGMFTTTDALRALRSQLSGREVEPVVRSSHLVDAPNERARVEHHVRMSSQLSSHGASPTPNQGRIGRIS